MPIIKIVIFWVTSSYSFMGTSETFGRTCRLHLQGMSEWRLQVSLKFWYLSTKALGAHNTPYCNIGSLTILNGAAKD
jgi:hypothetical protein